MVDRQEHHRDNPQRLNAALFADGKYIAYRAQQRPGTRATGFG